MIREYLKLARSFNAVLTGISPVMGAIAMEQYDIFLLFLLFLIGFLGHTYGFVLNDIIDYNLDKSSKEIKDRPLLSGTISLKNAWIFAIGSMIFSFIIASYIAMITDNYFPLLLLIISAVLITVYNLISKKFPGMDIFVAFAVFFLILYGASTVINGINFSKLTWIVCILGSTQVLFMQFIAGGLKDIENDYKHDAKTLAIRLGVRIENKILKISNSFKVLAYGLQIINVAIVFLPFIIIWNLNNLTIINYLQWLIIILILVLMLLLSYKLLSMKKFQRSKARKIIGSHYMINFMIVPIMLMKLNPWTGVLIFFPFLGFVLNNLILHGTILQPKTM